MSFRSEPLKLCQIIVQKDTAFSCVVELGQHALVQFKDLNHQMSVFQRTYVREVRGCTELERCIRYIEKEVIDGGAVDHIPPLDVSKTEVSSQREMYDLETRLYDLERDIRNFLQNEAQLKRNFNDLKQCKSVYEKVEAFFRVHIENTAKTELENDLVEVNDVGTPLTPLMEQHESPWFIVGTIDTQKQHSFERVLWRACRRTAFVRTAEIDNYFEDPDTGKLISKSVFIIFFNGSKLQDIVNRVCEGFNAKQYSCPKTSKERQLALADILIRLHDLNLVIQTTEKHKLELLRGAAFELPEWVRQVHLQKCAFHTLNLFTFDRSGNFSVAECWVLELKMDTVLQCLQLGVEKSGGTFQPIMKVLETEEPHPTYNRTTKFTQVFQNIVDSYAIASYREINPVFTIITFPFLFGIMFGDFGHGVILLLAGLGFLFYEKKIVEMRIKDEIFTMFFNGRFIIICMGLFSMYAGLIYNDVFAKSVNIFGSKWIITYNQSELKLLLNRSTVQRPLIDLNPQNAYLREEGSYYIGVDPIWNLSLNKLNFVNSMKMKLSIVIGVIQMLFGVILCFLNTRFFRSPINMFTIAIPQIIFLSSIFLYFCALIIGKWILFFVWPKNVFGYYYPGSHCAPSLLIGFINMFMFKKRNSGFVQPNTTVEYPNCHLSTWYPHQSTIEALLVIIAVSCVPTMLFGKPLSKALRRKNHVKLKKYDTRRINKSKNININVETERKKLVFNDGEHNYLAKDQNDVEMNRRGSSTYKKLKQQPEQKVVSCPVEEDMKMVDLVVHQAIHTIEFVLGCVSHTASYLRLWALSLAHSQLSEVLWHMVLAPSFAVKGQLAPVAIFAATFLFFVLTVSVLVLMEGLSAFLHALRLHWVEFQSKFYEGAGFPFVAFSLKNSLKKLCSESIVY